MLFSNPLPVLARALRVLGCAALACGGLAQAATFTVLLAEASVPQLDFARQLREQQDSGSRFNMVRIDDASRIPTEPSTMDDDRAHPDAPASLGGVNSRGVRPALAPEAITVAVGLRAAQIAIERPGNEPLLLAMLSRLEYESLRRNPALQRPGRRVGVLLRDPSMTDQLALIAAALPQKHRLGLVVTVESEPLLDELRRAVGPASGWDLQIGYAADAKALAGTLRRVLPRSDVLVVLPDLIGDSQAATLAVLRAGASAGLPVFGPSEGMVRSGGLAAAVSTPAQLARQASALSQKLWSGAANGASPLLVEAATPASVRVNLNVARALDLRLPDERELAERVAAAR